VFAFGSVRVLLLCYVRCISCVGNGPCYDDTMLVSDELEEVHIAASSLVSGSAKVGKHVSDCEAKKAVLVNERAFY